jgi:GNAT superfamily N-acetyltransferase
MALLSPNSNINITRLRPPLTVQRVEDMHELNQYLTDRPIDLLDTARNLIEMVYRGNGQFIAIAEQAGHIVGRSVLTYKPLPESRTAYVDSVVVDPKVQGLGVAKGLHDLIEDVALYWGVEKLQLTSSAKRAAALAMYESLGYQRRETNFLEKALVQDEA